MFHTICTLTVTTRLPRPRFDHQHEREVSKEGVGDPRPCEETCWPNSRHPVLQSTPRPPGHDSEGLHDQDREQLDNINKQSPDIAGGVRVGKDDLDVGAGDHGIVLGNAIDETAPHSLDDNGFWKEAELLTTLLKLAALQVALAKLRAQE